MFSKLRGLIDSIADDELILDVNGVGYCLFCSANTLRNLPANGQLAQVWVETHVREDHIHLYGFGNEAEREAFRTLTKVSGIGAKLALAILSALTPSALATAIAAQDKTTIQSVPGIGPKMAIRLLTELKDRFALPLSANVTMLHSGNATAPKESSVLNDALSALTHLGYSRSDAYTALQRAFSQAPDLSLNEAIKAGLKELAA